MNFCLNHLRIKTARVKFPPVAKPTRFGQSQNMSDKQMVLDSIERLPDDASLEVITERVEFLAALRKGLDQIETGKTVPHSEVKRQLASWLSK